MKLRMNLSKIAAAIGVVILMAGLFALARMFDPKGKYYVIWIANGDVGRFSFPSVWVLGGIVAFWLAVSPGWLVPQAAAQKKLMESLMRLRKLACLSLGYYVAQLSSMFAGDWWDYISEKPRLEELYADILIVAFLTTIR